MLRYSLIALLYLSSPLYGGMPEGLKEHPIQITSNNITLNDTEMIQRLNEVYVELNQWCPAMRVAQRNDLDAFGALFFTLALMVVESFELMRRGREAFRSLYCGIESIFMLVSFAITLTLTIMNVMKRDHIDNRYRSNVVIQGTKLVGDAFKTNSSKGYGLAVINQVCRDFVECLDQEYAVVEAKNNDVIWNKFLASVSILLLSTWMHTNRGFFTGVETRSKLTLFLLGFPFLVNIYQLLYGYRAFAHSSPGDPLDKRDDYTASDMEGNMLANTSLAAFSSLLFGIFLMYHDMNNNIKDWWKIMLAFSISAYQMISAAHDAEVLRWSWMASYVRSEFLIYALGSITGLIPLDRLEVVCSLAE